VVRPPVAPSRRPGDVPSTVPPAARAAILAWYDDHGRRLPFRASRDPYAILVSEAMAQQTQAARAGQRWTRFMARFPSAQALAAATLADVLREWQGLGYNRRARDLWLAARAIVDDHGGSVPRDVTELERLPGVGPYTARAVAAIAYGRPVGAVDTNVRRVLGRISGVGDAPPRELQALADAAVPPDRAAAWTHAVMDIGARFCRPRPRCEACPARPWCRAAAAGPDPVAAPRPVRHSTPFASTTRWLRGRLLDRLRGAPDGTWTGFAEPLGAFDEAAVRSALWTLANEGLAELHPENPAMARLPAG
jgi:A/G-specific adenine glycosylase